MYVNSFSYLLSSNKFKVYVTKYNYRAEKYMIKVYTPIKANSSFLTRLDRISEHKIASCYRLLVISAILGPNLPRNVPRSSTWPDIQLRFQVFKYVEFLQLFKGSLNISIIYELQTPFLKKR